MFLIAGAVVVDHFCHFVTDKQQHSACICNIFEILLCFADHWLCTWSPVLTGVLMI